MTITKVDKATNRRSRRVKRPDKFVSPSEEEHFGCTYEYIVRNHGRMSAASQRLPKTKTAPHTSCVRCELPTHNFIRVVDFPDDCDSKLDECYGHTTEVLRGRIGTRQLIAIAEGLKRDLGGDGEISVSALTELILMTQHFDS